MRGFSPFWTKALVPVRRSASDLGDGSYSIDFTWSSDSPPRLYKEKTKLNISGEFINQSKGRGLEWTLLHNYRRFSIFRQIL